ncbi:MAG: hypothetical protein ACMVP2_01490 [Imperialibacter sp.]|uniref:hypothetical protein n=1 Tax=Imperialibacter sp. TaxID=2038411 RepID=UPI003A8B8044
MENLELIFSTLFLLGVIAFVAALIKYPKDFVKLVWGFIIFPFERAWDLLILILTPFWLLLLILDDILGLKVLPKVGSKISTKDYKTISRQPINFVGFEKFILVNSLDINSIREQLVEARETYPEVNIENYTIDSRTSFSIIHLPSSSFYGFNFLVMWLAEHFKGQEVYGYARNGTARFFNYVDSNTENSLIGMTNRRKKFWVSMYDNLDEKQYLRINNSIPMDSKLTTDFFEDLMSEKAP